MRGRTWVAAAVAVPMTLAGMAAGPGAPAMAAGPGPGIITTVAGGPGRGPDWSVTQHPLSVATGPGGAVYVTDQIGVVREFTGSATWEKVVAGVGGMQAVPALTYGGDGGAATRAHLGMADGMAVDAAGNLVIADTSNNRIRVVAENTGTFYGRPMTAGDIYTVAGDGTAGSTGDGGPAIAAGLDQPGDVAVDAAGNLIIADSGSNRIRIVAEQTGTFYGQKMTAGNIYRIAGEKWGSGGGGGGPALLASLRSPESVMIDTAGNMVIADTFSNRIRVVAEQTGTFYGQKMTAGNIYRLAGHGAGFSGDGGPGRSADLRTPFCVTADSAGNIVICDSGNSRVRVLAETTGTFYGRAMTAGDIYTIAGNGQIGYSGDGGPATAGRLNQPTAVAFDGVGNMLIADAGNARVRVAAAGTGTSYGRAMTAGDIYTVAGHGAPMSGNGGPAGDAVLGCPVATAVTSSGNVAIGTSGEVQLVPAAAGTFFGQAMTAGHIYAVAGNGLSGFSGDGGPATKAELNSPSSVAFDGNGNLLISDTFNNRVRVTAAATGTFYGQPMTAGDIYTIAGNGLSGYSGDGGPATSAELGNPSGATVDGSGNVVIADINNSRIRVIAGATGRFYGQPMTAGDIYTITGDGEPGYSGDGGPASSAELAYPSGVTVDGSGNVVIADVGNERIRVIAGATGRFYGQPMTAGDIYTIAGDGQRGYSGDGGPATSATLALPYWVTVDGQGNVVIADNGTNRVRVTAATTGTFYGQPMTAGDIYTIAGNGQQGYFGDGAPGPQARLATADGVAADGPAVFIADCGNGVVREVRS